MAKVGLATNIFGSGLSTWVRKKVYSVKFKAGRADLPITIKSFSPVVLNCKLQCFHEKSLIRA
jgi:hypothetical protein